MSTETPAVSWALKSFGNALEMISKPLSMMDQKPNGISVMLLIRMPRSGTITAGMKSRKANRKHTLWKQITQNCVITWLAWQENPGVSRAARMHSTVLSAYSFTATTVAN